MKPCRECGQEVSEQALICPHCGAPQPAREKWDGWGFEYKSGYALAQFGIAYSLIAQFGLYLDRGWGQFVRDLSDLWQMF